MDPGDQGVAVDDFFGPGLVGEQLLFGDNGCFEKAVVAHLDTAAVVKTHRFDLREPPMQPEPEICQRVLLPLVFNQREGVHRPADDR